MADRFKFKDLLERLLGTRLKSLLECAVADGITVFVKRSLRLRREPSLATKRRRERMSHPAAVSDVFRFMARDPRSDDRLRIVDVSRKTIAIRRRVLGVAMTIRVAPTAYRGVAMNFRGQWGGRLSYEVRLTHGDPDLSVLLAEGHDQRAMEAEWRRWVRFLCAPALLGCTGGRQVEVNIDATDLARRLPVARRRSRSVARRRPNFLMRRKTGRVWSAQPGIV